MSDELSRIVGIDVSKARLDFFYSESWSVLNAWDSISKLAAKLIELQPKLIVITLINYLILRKKVKSYVQLQVLVKSPPPFYYLTYKATRYPA